MSKKVKDTDYLYLSTYLRAQEPKMLGRDRIERMLTAKTAADAARILEECGYGTFETVTASVLEEKIAARRAAVMEDLARLAPDVRVVDAFRVRYDYHNAKVLVKSGGTRGQALLSSAGRVPPQQMEEAFSTGSFAGLPQPLAAAMCDARDTLARSGDPQLADFILDKAYFEEFLKLAQACGSAFLEGYVRLSADCANLKSAVRAQRMGKDAAFCRKALVPAGTVDSGRLAGRMAAREPLAPLFDGTRLSAAARAGDEAVAGGRLTEFERACDNAQVEYLRAAKLTGFGEKVLVCFICALENELSTARIVLTGRIGGLDEHVIRERLRESYV